MQQINGVPITDAFCQTQIRVTDFDLLNYSKGHQEQLGWMATKYPRQSGDEWAQPCRVA